MSQTKSPKGKATKPASSPLISVVTVPGGKLVNERPTPAPATPQNPEQRFTFVARVVIVDGITLEIVGKEPVTKEQIKDKAKEFHDIGFTVFADDLSKAHTYMPRSILRIVWTLTPVKESAPSEA